MLICGHATYHESYLSKAQTILTNAKKFNDNCHIFDLEPSEIDDAATQSIWDLAAPGVAQDDAETQISGFEILQKRKMKILLAILIRQSFHPKGVIHYLNYIHQQQNIKTCHSKNIVLICDY